MANRVPSGKHIFLIGPGGVGKTTVAPLIAERLERPCVDLDQEFCDRIENIGTFIGSKGYLPYVEANSSLFADLLEEVKEQPSVIPVSSGFLSSDSPHPVFEANRERCFASTPVLLLPSPVKQASTEIVVERLVQRHGEFGFHFETAEARETFQVRAAQTFARRFDEYLSLGCITVFSSERPEVIAGKVIRELVHA